MLLKDTVSVESSSALKHISLFSQLADHQIRIRPSGSHFGAWEIGIWSYHMGMCGHIRVNMCTYHSWENMGEYKCYQKWKSQNVLIPFEQSTKKVYHQSKQQCSSATKMYYGDFIFVFSPLYISLVLCKLVWWNLQKKITQNTLLSHHCIKLTMWIWHPWGHLKFHEWLNG